MISKKLSLWTLVNSGLSNYPWISLQFQIINQTPLKNQSFIYTRGRTNKRAKDCLLNLKVLFIQFALKWRNCLNVSVILRMGVQKRSFSVCECFPNIFSQLKLDWKSIWSFNWTKTILQIRRRMCWTFILTYFILFFHRISSLAMLKKSYSFMMLIAFNCFQLYN